jgi:hypothetical protein
LHALAGGTLFIECSQNSPTATVIFASATDGEGYVIPPTGFVRQFFLGDAAVLVTIKRLHGIGPNPLLIADSILPPVLPFPTLVVSSPDPLSDRNLKNKLNDYWIVWHYMPIPTDEELLALREVAFPQVSETDARERMKLWGPIPRLVLEMAALKHQKVLWQKAKAVSLERLGQFSRGEQNRNKCADAADLLVHERAAGQDATPGSREADFHTEDYYVRCVGSLASLSIIRYVAERMKAEGK